jgi:hypothetical protein
MIAMDGSRRRRGWRCVLLIAVASLGCVPGFGCSFLFLTRPRDEYATGEPIDCTTSNALPGMDMAFTGLHLASLAILASSSGDSFGGARARQAGAQVDLFWLPIFLGSAIWGYYKVDRCRDLVGGDVEVVRRPVRRVRPVARRLPVAPTAPAPEPFEPAAPTGLEPAAAVAPAAREPSPAASAAPVVPQQIDDEDAPVRPKYVPRPRPVRPPDAITAPSPRPPGP